MYPFGFLAHNDHAFSAPHGSPVTFPLNQHVKFSPPPVPNELRSAVKQPPIPRLPQGTFFNSSNPGRLNVYRR